MSFVSKLVRGILNAWFVVAIWLRKQNFMWKMYSDGFFLPKNGRKWCASTPVAIGIRSDGIFCTIWLIQGISITFSSTLRRLKLVCNRETIQVNSYPLWFFCILLLRFRILEFSSMCLKWDSLGIISIFKFGWMYSYGIDSLRMIFFIFKRILIRDLTLIELIYLNPANDMSVQMAIKRPID